MTEQEWLKQFDDSKDQFKWFIVRHFETMWQHILIERKRENISMLMSIMNNIWFALPDGIYNVMVNPKGWDEFLFLLENPPEQENPNDDPSINDNLEQS